MKNAKKEKPSFPAYYAGRRFDGKKFSHIYVSLLDNRALSFSGKNCKHLTIGNVYLMGHDEGEDPLNAKTFYLPRHSYEAIRNEHPEPSETRMLDWSGLDRAALELSKASKHKPKTEDINDLVLKLKSVRAGMSAGQRPVFDAWLIRELNK